MDNKLISSLAARLFEIDHELDRFDFLAMTALGAPSLEKIELTEENRLWWADKVKKYYGIALEQGYAEKVDIDALSYAIWCFCRGYYADALSRQLPKDEAVRYFTFGFACLLNGVVR